MAGTGTSHLRPDGEAVLRVEDLVVEFPVSGGRTVHAVSGISFDLLEGETLGLVGESGCGKSSSGRAILQLRPPTSGSVKLEGVELTELQHRELRRVRTRLQMVFQDPISSLNPRRRVRDIVAEGLDIWGRPDDADQRIDDTLRAVGLDPDTVGDRRPHEFSGGQCQRISIARALVMDPRVLVCDEPVSALDVSVQAQILNLLHDMRGRFGLTMIFIAHDLSVVNHISDRVMVMYLGKVCEVAAPDALFRAPHHPYTELLISSIPQPDPPRRTDRPTPTGRDALPHRSAQRLSFPNTMPARLRPLRRRGADARRDLDRPPCRLSPPAAMTERSTTSSPRPDRSLVVRRLGARAVDLFTVFFCTFALAVTVLVPVMAPLTDLLDRGPWGRSLGPALLIALVGIVYETVFTAGRGQTPAKDLFCIKVVDAATPDPPARRRVAIRATMLWSWVVVPLPASTVAAGVVIVVVAGMAVTALDPARRAPHDRLLTTEVIAYDADAVEGAIVATPSGVIEARYGARSWWRSLAGMVTR